jgi:hypothetical protein
MGAFVSVIEAIRESGKFGLRVGEGFTVNYGAV